jgi:DNA-binding MarR family transcriptional regulator
MKVPVYYIRRYLGNMKNRELLDQFSRLEWLIRRNDVRGYREKGPIGTRRRGQGRILTLLRLRSEISQKELAVMLDMTSQSLGELLAKLERSGYITRTPLADDRRARYIYLTEAGKAASEDAEDPNSPEKLFDCLNNAERTLFGDCLGKLMECFEKNLKENESKPHSRRTTVRRRPDLHGGTGFDGSRDRSRHDFEED